jgi:excinuclease ABC subunit A
VVAAGAPEEIAEIADSYTGQFVRHVLKLEGSAVGTGEALARACVANGNGRVTRTRVAAASR